MRYPSSQMYVMSGEDDLTRFWGATFAMNAATHRTIFADEILREDGLHALHKTIDKDIRDHKITLLLLDISTPSIDPFALASLRTAHGLTIALLALDDEFKFDWISASYATVADLVLTTDCVAADRYRQAGVNAHFFVLPIPIPPSAPEESPSREHYGISFVGAVRSKPSRAALARYLDEQGITVRYFSNTGSRDPAFLSREEMNSVFRRSVINLNFTGITTYAARYNGVLCERIRGMKIRPLEILAAGGFCISEYSISLARALDAGTELVFFTSKEDLVDKLRHFGARPDEAKRIMEDGRRRVCDQYSSSAVSKRLEGFIRGALDQRGCDLYGNRLELKVSPLLASTFMVSTIANCGSLLLRGRVRGCADDVVSVVGFALRFRAQAGTASAMRVLGTAAYRLAKVAVAMILSRLGRLASHASHRE